MIYEKFGNLQPREVFIYRGRYYIRTGIVTADSMFNGPMATFNFDDLVIKNVALPQKIDVCPEFIIKVGKSITVNLPVVPRQISINMVFA